jgi:DNA helicase-2/ATP-dependent DNA helicase PcrA
VGGVRFYERREIKDVFAYLQLVVNPADEAAFARAVSWPRRGVGSVTLEKLRRGASEGGLALLAAAEVATDFPGLPRAGAAALQDFASGISALSEFAVEADCEEVIRECIRSFGLVTALESEDDGADRIANLTELLAAASAFDPADVLDGVEGATDLELYLQAAALRADIDEYNESAPGVTLMTLHNAKGLEFPLVYLVGLEDGLFPLSRAMESEHELEEERRLFYVGVTRAEDRLVITHAQSRWRYGSEQRAAPSQFLSELPEGPVQRHWSAASAAAGRRARRTGRPVNRAPVPAPDLSTGEWNWRRPKPGTARTKAVSGVRYDYSDSQEELRVESGARVVHPEFGEGEIVTVTGRGTALKAEIDFGEAGVRKVMVAHAGLRPL